MSFTRVSKRFPKMPPGCERAKSLGVKPLASEQVRAKASPSNRVATEEVVGARPRGQASCRFGSVINTLLCLARVDPAFPVIQIIDRPSFLSEGSMVMISGVSPEFERARIISSGDTMPRSPCRASAGWMKKAGVPVLQKVAAILFAMCPDLPIPVQITFPVVCNSALQASAKLGPMHRLTCCKADSSAFKKCWARCSSFSVEDVLSIILFSIGQHFF